ncbi:MAG: c-type cytochrome [Thermoanaerobaculia bacterium]
MRTCARILIVVASSLVLACGGSERAAAPAASTTEGSATAAKSAPADEAAAAPTTDAMTTGAPAQQATTTGGTSPWAPPSTTAPAPAVPVVEPITPGKVTGSAANGATLFAARCASCHGDTAKGDTAIGKKYAVLDFRSADVRALTTTDLSKIMKLGKGKLSEGAHPKANLTDQDVKDMVAFIQSLK